MNVVASDTEKLHAEKARLAKEVSIMKSEVEKLRSQNISANLHLTEQHGIVRQLNAVEVQLDNEKRAHERVLTQQSQQADKVAALTSRLEETRRELQLARRQGQQDTQQNVTMVADSSPVTSKGRDNSRSMAMRKDHQEATTTQQQDDWTSKATKVPAERLDRVHPKKPSSRLNSELTIATPGAVRAQIQQKRSSTLPGEKSSFSITPFLNRTTGIEESPTSSDDELNESYYSGATKHDNDLVVRGANQSRPPVSKQTSKPAKQIPTKADSRTDSYTKHKQNLLDSPDETGGYQIPLSRPSSQKQPLTKKRKLGMQRDRSLFDEDEGDNNLPDSRKPGRKNVGTAHTSLAGSRAFADPEGFSPLKRDRRRF